MSSGWPTVSFGEIFEITSSKRVLQRQWADEGVPFYRAREIVKLAKDGRVQNELFISEELYSELSSKYGTPEPGDLMVSAVGTLGACYVVQPNDRFYFKDASVLRFHPKAQVLPRFIQHAFATATMRDQIASGSGSTVGTLTISRANELKIPLPPLEEQKRIAGILDQAEELCRLRTRALDKLNTLGQAIFHEMFGDWQIDAKNWPIVELGDELEFLTSGSRGWAKYYSDSGAKFIRIQNVRRDYFDKHDMAFVSAPENAEAKRTKVRPGDVLLSITADLGRTAVVPEGIGDAHINQHLAILRLRSMNPQYVSAALSSAAGQRVIQKKNREGVKAGLNFDDIRGIELPKPPMEFQEEYVARIRELFALQSKAEDAQRHSDTLFSSLQHRAFRGEL
ncbi:restriction endonuclease subunit S [Cribrihabitans pelagius]|uniref:restriction endonuclease subunit S n=1 Tax=Cribrihabitans pelagius TaxID=1765746 RepID=UPI003B59BCF3